MVIVDDLHVVYRVYGAGGDKGTAATALMRMLRKQRRPSIREVHAIAHVVRCFEDENIVHVEGRIDPPSDVATIDTELGAGRVGDVADPVERRSGFNIVFRHRRRRERGRCGRRGWLRSKAGQRQVEKLEA